MWWCPSTVGRARPSATIGKALSYLRKKSRETFAPGFQRARLILALLAWTPALSSFSQNSPATFPNARLSSGGSVYALVVQDDGKVIIGGNFSSVNGRGRTNLARLNPNGSLDETWNPAMQIGGVKTLALAGTNLFAIGSFTAVGDVPRPGIAKISILGTGALDTAWNPGFGGATKALTISGDYLYLGGSGLLGNWPNYTNLVRISLSGTGAVDSIWTPNIRGEVRCLATDGTNIYVGGNLTNIAGVPWGKLAKVGIASGLADFSWSPNVIPGAGSFVSAVQWTNGFLYVGGSFTNIGGLGRTNLAKLGTTDAAADASWAPRTSMAIGSLVLNGNDLYALNIPGIGGPNRTNVARFSASGTGSVDPSWNPQPDFDFYALAANGPTIYAGGDFRQLRGGIALGVAKLDPINGARDDSFAVQVELPAYISSLARQADGKIIIGGSFDSVGGFRRKNLVRFNADGSLDPSWNPSPNASVRCIVISGNDVFISGTFSQVGNSNRFNLAKLSAVGPDTPDPRWIPKPFPQYAYPDALAVGGTNLYAALGGFVSYQLKDYVAKFGIMGSGERDDEWGPTNAFYSQDQDPIWSMAASGPDLFITGLFAALGYEFVKLAGSLDGQFDPSWVPAGSWPFALASWDTNLYASSSSGLIKMSTADGLLDPSWTPPSNFPVKLLGRFDSNLFAYGVFTNNLGEYITNIVKLNAGGAGEMDQTWNFPLAAAISTLGGDYFIRSSNPTPFAAKGKHVYLGGQGFLVGNGFAFFPVAEAPSLIKRSPTNLVILPNPDNGYEVTHFRITGISGGTLSLTNGVGIDPGDFITAEQGAAGLIFSGANNGTITVVSSLNATTNGTGSASSTLDFSLPQGPVFSFSSANYSALESSNLIRVTVQKWGTGTGSVQYATSDGTALAYDLDSDTGDYVPVSGTLNFPAGETNKSFVIFLNDTGTFIGDRTFWISLTNPGSEGQLVYPATAAITIVDDNAFGPTVSVTASQSPNPVAPAAVTGALVVSLQPTNANGQWRFGGELFWRNSGDVVRGLVAGPYVIQFKPAANFAFLPDATALVTAGQTNFLGAIYAAGPGQPMGLLSVVLNPPNVATNSDLNQRGQWRLLGETAWHDSGSTVSNVSSGGQVVQFKHVPNYVEPPSRAITVNGGSDRLNLIEDSRTTYFGPVAGPGAFTPSVLSFASVTDSNWPYRYNGQIQSDVGYSSGVVVKERVVLTVAHAVFDDVTLDWVKDVRWFFQEHAGDYQAAAQVPRGWYVASGYAAQRSNDVDTGTVPGYSTTASQQLDVAALYFVATDYSANKPGRGGFGGFVASDAGAYNEFLTGNSNKFLAGYPLIPGQETNWNRMYASVPTNLSFTSLSPKIFRTTGVLSYPGNSGGPLYVQSSNGVYYPAGIYLGEGLQTLVRVIDSQVVDLINRAQASGDSGGTFAGGEVISVSPNYNADPLALGYVQVLLGPPTATNAGGAWRVQARNIDFTSDPNIRIPLVGGGDFIIEFRPVPGWLLPTNQIVGVAPNQLTILTANYIEPPPRLAYSISGGVTIFGAQGLTYRVDYAGNLNGPINWIPLATNTLTTNILTLSGTPPVSSGSRFFRAVRLP